jgi:hypothetical protein
LFSASILAQIPFDAHTIVDVNNGANGASSVYAADVDGDGDMDVLSASFNDDKIAWYENDGRQNFTNHIITRAADGAQSVYAADVDGTAIWMCSRPLLMMTKSPGMKTMASRTSPAMSLRALQHRPDPSMLPMWTVTGIWMYSRRQGSVTILPGMKTMAGRISPAIPSPLMPMGPFLSMPPMWTGTGIWMCSLPQGTKSPGMKMTTRRISPAIALRPLQMEPDSVYAADVDGDGDVDVLSASYNGTTIAWYENDGRQNFSSNSHYDLC